MDYHRGPAFLRIRKSAWFGIGLILFFLFRSIWPQIGIHKTDLKKTTVSTIDSVSLVLCHNVLDGVPFGVDSEFHAGRDRVHAFSIGPKTASMSHIWFFRGDSIARTDCLGGGICHSSLSPDSLRNGDWSVDLMVGRKLLASHQFRITP